MKSEKTIICRIQNLTKRKRGLLIKEYTNAQGYLKEDIEDLYSATKQAMDKYTEKVKENKEYPLHLRNDTFKVEKAENTEKFDYWAKIPVSNIWGGIWVPIKPHKEITEDMKVHDSKIVWKDYGFELHLSISLDVNFQVQKNVLSVDLGKRVMATTVSSANNGKPGSHGKQIRGIRRHYNHLRKKLQQKN